MFSAPTRSVHHSKRRILSACVLIVASIVAVFAISMGTIFAAGHTPTSTAPQVYTPAFMVNSGNINNQGYIPVSPGGSGSSSFPSTPAATPYPPTPTVHINPTPLTIRCANIPYFMTLQVWGGRGVMATILQVYTNGNLFPPSSIKQFNATGEFDTYNNPGVQLSHVSWSASKGSTSYPFIIAWINNSPDDGGTYAIGSVQYGQLVFVNANGITLTCTFSNINASAVVAR